MANPNDAVCLLARPTVLVHAQLLPLGGLSPQLDGAAPPFPFSG
jgi:hypothetical protein